MAKYLTISAILLCSAVLADARPASTQTVDELVAAFADPDWTARMAAFYRLVKLGADPSTSDSPYPLPQAIENVLAGYPASADNVRLGLIGLLALENSRTATMKAEYLASGGTVGLASEESAGFHGDVVAAVAVLADQRSVDVLMGALPTGYPAIGVLASFGPHSLNGALVRLQSADEILRGGAVLVLWLISPTVAGFPSSAQVALTWVHTPGGMATVLEPEAGAVSFGWMPTRIVIGIR